MHRRAHHYRPDAAPSPGTPTPAPQPRADAQTYTPPKAVQEAAERAVRWIDEGRAGKGFTKTGRARAGQLSRGEAVSLDVVERMAYFFSRMTYTTRAKGFDVGEAGYPTPGRVAWDAWGGDAGLRWANGILDEIDRKAARDAERSARTDRATRSKRTDKADRTTYRTSGQVSVRYDDAGAGLSDDDRALLDPPRQLPDGSWLFHALLARAGEVKEYEWGPELSGDEEELSHPDTLQSFEGARITIDHPPQLITPTTPPPPRHVLPDARVTRAVWREDAQALTAYLHMPARPSQRGVSVGWDVGLIDKTTTPPTHRDLLANHVALTHSPRVPGAGPRLDAAPPEAPSMEEVEVTLPDGKVVKIPKSMLPVFEAMKADSDNLRAEVDRLKIERDKLQGAMDSKSGEAAEAARMDAINRAVSERVALSRRASRVLGEAEAQRLDGKPAREVKLSLLAKLDAKADASKWSDAYLDGVLETLERTQEHAQGYARQDARDLDTRPPQGTTTPAQGSPRTDASLPLTMAQINAKLMGGR